MDLTNKPRNLAEALAGYQQAYLLTASRGAPHAVPVAPRVEGDVLIVQAPGRHTRDNVARQPAVALLWPPALVSDYSLIVDGQATLDDTSLRVTPARVVLQRPAAIARTAPEGSCAADCIELDLHLPG